MKLSRVYAAFYLSLIISCSPAYTVQRTEQNEYILSDSSNMGTDSTAYAYILPFKTKVETAMADQVAESEFTMERGVPEGRLGNFVADACMSEAAKIYYPSDNMQADFSFFNNGGLRRPLPKGKITRGDVFELMPFENELVVLKINGGLVKKIFNFIASKGGCPVSGARFQIRDHEAINITIHDQALDTSKSYKVLTSDYLANGGESFDFITEIPRENVNLKMRDAILQYMISFSKEGKTISVNTDGRISNAK